MEPAQSKSGLLALPRELRDFIWENTIEDTPQRLNKFRRRAVAQPAISKVCKLIRNETLPIFLSVTTFDLDFRNGAAIKKAKDWILDLKESARHLRKFDFYHNIVESEGDSYAIRLRLNPKAQSEETSLANVQYDCTERMSLTYDALDALDDKRTALIWDLQHGLNAVIDDGNIRSMGRKEWLSVLFLIREYFDSTERLFAEFGG
ncbi:hypothetical protein LTR15_007913 [Elasticomyces elasticus]|nr:hypothetical protein LTR15_007913 [Elasticomyces elasticus]